ncbi:hypothetical protein SALBM311S_06631 [Streptomyces alboniger]
MAAVAATTHDLNYVFALSHPVPYIIGDMDSGRYSIEIEPEVRLWLENIPAHHYKQAERVADLLAEQPTTLDEPHARRLRVPMVPRDSGERSRTGPTHAAALTGLRG